MITLGLCKHVPLSRKKAFHLSSSIYFTLPSYRHCSLIFLADFVSVFWLWSKPEEQILLGSAASWDTICHLISGRGKKKVLIFFTLKHTHAHTHLVCRLCRFHGAALCSVHQSSHGGLWKQYRGQLPAEGLWRNPLKTQTNTLNFQDTKRIYTFTSTLAFFEEIHFLCFLLLKF